MQLLLLLLQLICFSAIVYSNACMKLDLILTQKIENEGYHRNVCWLLEKTSPNITDWITSQCSLMVNFHVNGGFYLNKDELAELNTNNSVFIRVDGKVDIEAIAHEASSHSAFVYILSNELERIQLQVPIHLRYQRAQITGKYGKVNIRRPSILVKCPTNVAICGRRRQIVDAPCNSHSQQKCQWQNITYQAHFEDVELLVPIGDLDDYPLVSIVSLFLGCAGCIYILSILSTAPV